MLANHNIPQVRHPPYSADLDPRDIFHIPQKINPTWKGIQKNMMKQLLAVRKKKFTVLFHQWKTTPDKVGGFRR